MLRPFCLGSALLLLGSGALIGCVFDSSVPSASGAGGGSASAGGGASTTTSDVGSSSSVTSGGGQGGGGGSPSSSSSGEPCACPTGTETVVGLPSEWTFVELGAADENCDSGDTTALTNLAKGDCTCECGGVKPGQPSCGTGARLRLNRPTPNTATACDGDPLQLIADGGCRKWPNSTTVGKGDGRRSYVEYDAPTSPQVYCEASAAAPEPDFVGRSCALQVSALECATATVCAPPSACVQAKGDIAECPGGFPRRSVYYVPGSDPRACGTCECRADVTACGGATLTGYSNDKCSKDEVEYKAGPECSDPYKAGKDTSYYVATAPEPTFAECKPSGLPPLFTGAAPSAADTYTVCCAD